VHPDQTGEAGRYGPVAMRTGNHVVLVPGGLYEDMDSTRFWVDPGILAGLQSAGCRVTAIDRIRHPLTWAQDAAALAAAISEHGVVGATVVAGSNGCSAAVRLALDHPRVVARLVLCWPATAGDRRVDRISRAAITDGAGEEVAEGLLAGDTLRGISDNELQALRIPVAVVPSEPENPHHQASTVVALARLLPNVTVTDGYPESPRPEFPPLCADFVTTLAGLLACG